MYKKDKSLSKSGEYVFLKTTDGVRFVGQFDELYREIKDPWGQIEDDYYKKRRFDLVSSLRNIGATSVLDVGCGLGHVTQAIKIMVCKNVVGVDISKVAVNRAKKLFPDVKFEVCDIRKQFPKGRYDAVILNGILWYILDDLKDIFKKIEQKLDSGGYLIISQPFIKDQQFGREIINGYEGFINFIYNHFGLFKLIKTEYNDLGERKTDSITILQKRR